MKNLSDNWLTEGLLDFEYKKYVLLAYLRHVSTEFFDNKLYPHLSDLIKHYSQLTRLKNEREHWEAQFPKSVKGVDWNQLQLIYEKLEASTPSELEEVYNMVEFAIPRMRENLERGKEAYESIESQIELRPIGLHPVYKGEGYLVLGVDKHPFWEVYRYQSTVFTQAKEKYRGIHLTFLDRVRKRVGRTLEQLKLELVRTYREMPNPATFGLASPLPFPIEPTLLPIGKRLLMKQVAV
ncbi:MAG TPA: hypothetical protein DCE41_28800 [Cytophagales bacterium]|nr:hypothetical protein [Cytophagales bacterium]HAA19704.1 hypothetical protein [Cytophagales bacterium]HAP61635.1 hypothetical protein [Cytophagales bacterium]